MAAIPMTTSTRRPKLWRSRSLKQSSCRRPPPPPPISLYRRTDPRRSSGRPRPSREGDLGGYNSNHPNGGERRHSPSITSQSRSRSADIAPPISRPYYTRRAEIDPLYRSPLFQLFSNSDRRRDLETMRIRYCVRRPVVEGGCRRLSGQRPLPDGAMRKRRIRRGGFLIEF